MVFRLKDLSLVLQHRKPLKKVRIVKSLFLVIKSIIRIDHEESENHGPEKLEPILKASGHQNHTIFRDFGSRIHKNNHKNKL